MAAKLKILSKKEEMELTNIYLHCSDHKKKKEVIECLQSLAKQLLTYEQTNFVTLLERAVNDLILAVESI